MTDASPLAGLGVFALLWWVQLAVPGPNFVRITNIALLGTRGAAMLTASGVAAGNALWCVIALSGAAIFQDLPALRLLIAVAGASYFAWLGLRLVQKALRPRPATPAPPLALSADMAFRQGLATSLSSPQALAYFTAAIVAGFHDMSLSLGAQLIAIVIGVNLVWYELITRLLDSVQARDAFRRYQPVIEGIFGILLLVAAAKLAAPLASL